MQVTKESPKMRQRGLSRISVLPPPLVELHSDVYVNGYLSSTYVKLVLSVVPYLRSSIRFSSPI